MAVTYGFYNSVNGDRKYNAVQMAQIFDGIIEDGVFNSVGTAFAVTPSSGMVISVGAGRAWFNHTWTYNDAPITLTVGTAPVGSLKRIDAVVIEVDENNRSNSIKIIAGTESATPVKPTMVDSDGVHQHALAYISTEAGVTAITATMIASAVGTDTPFVTGPLETVGVTTLYNYWRAEFETWFDHLQDELDSNQAANLQHQIDDLDASKADAADLDALTQEILKTGDIKYTMRSSYDDGWALCNGDSISASEYPELCQMLTESGEYIDFTDVEEITDPSILDIQKSIYANGHWVILGNYRGQSYILWSTSQHGPWTKITLPSNYVIYDIVYENSTWVCCGYRGYGSSNTVAVVGYNTTSIEANNWAFKDLWTNVTNTGGEAYSIAYGRGLWVICGNRGINTNDKAMVYAYTSNPAETWTTNTLHNPTETTTSVIAYGVIYDSELNRFMMSTCFYGSSVYTIRLYYTTGSTSLDWTFVDMSYKPTGLANPRITKLNNLYVITFQNATWLLYSSSIYGPWTKIQVYGSNTDMGDYGTRFIAYVNGIFFTGGGRQDGSNGCSIIAVAKSIDGPWTVHDVLIGGHSAYGRGAHEIVSYARNGDDILFCGYTCTSGQSGQPLPRTISMPITNGAFNAVLPTIAPDVGNAFIKLDEGGA